MGKGWSIFGKGVQGFYKFSPRLLFELLCMCRLKDVLSRFIKSFFKGKGKLYRS